MLAALKQRTLIIGNSGSGKSGFADELSGLTGAPVIDLDLLHWEEDGRGAKRDEDAARRLVRDAAAGPRWIVEGVYGWLAEVAVPRATALLWLDLPWSLCRDGLMRRGRRRGGSDADFAALLDWAEAYWTRRTSSSFFGHARIFAAFGETKIRLRDREEIRRLLARIAGLGG